MTIAFRIAADLVFQVAGVPAIRVPSGSLEVRVGEVAYVTGNSVIFRVGSAVSNAKNGPHRTHYRQVEGHSPIRENMTVNRRGSAASIILTMAPGHMFETRGYSRNAEWKRFYFDGETVTHIIESVA